MFDGPREHVRDGLDPPVRVPRKTGQIVVWDVVAEVVEEQERVSFGRVAKSKSAPQVNARTFKCRLCFDKSFDGSNGHGVSA